MNEEEKLLDSAKHDPFSEESPSHLKNFFIRKNILIFLCFFLVLLGLASFFSFFQKQKQQILDKGTVKISKNTRNPLETNKEFFPFFSKTRLVDLNGLKKELNFSFVDSRQGFVSALVRDVYHSASGLSGTRKTTPLDSGSASRLSGQWYELTGKNLWPYSINPKSKFAILEFKNEMESIHFCFENFASVSNSIPVANEFLFHHLAGNYVLISSPLDKDIPEIYEKITSNLGKKLLNRPGLNFLILQRKSFDQTVHTTVPESSLAGPTSGGSGLQGTGKPLTEWYKYQKLSQTKTLEIQNPTTSDEQSELEKNSLVFEAHGEKFSLVFKENFMRKYPYTVRKYSFGSKQLERVYLEQGQEVLYFTTFGDLLLYCSSYKHRNPDLKHRNLLAQILGQ